METSLKLKEKNLTSCIEPVWWSEMPKPWCQLDSLKVEF